MSIGILKAINTIFSEKYNKKNLALYILLFSIISIIILIITMFIPETKIDNFYFDILFSLITMILLLFPGLLTTGFIAISTNNAIKLKKGVFPNPIKNLKRIFTIGFKYLAGCIGLVIPFLVIPIVLLIGLGYCLWTTISPAVGIIIPLIPLGFILWNFVIYISTADIRFLNTLKLKNMFKFKENYEIFKENRVLIYGLIGKRIIFSIILTLILMIPAIIISIIIMGKTQQIDIGDITNETLQMIYTFISMVVNVELTAQAGRLIFFEENKREKEAIMARKMKQKNI